MVLEVGVVPQKLVCDVLGDLLIDAGHGLLLGAGHLIPVNIFLLFLELLDPLCGLVAGDGLSGRLLADATQHIIVVVLLPLLLLFVVFHLFDLVVAPVLLFLQPLYFTF